MKQKDTSSDLDYMSTIPVATKATISPTTGYVLALTKTRSTAVKPRVSLEIDESGKRLQKGLSTDNNNLLLAQKLLHKGVIEEAQMKGYPETNDSQPNEVIVEEESLNSKKQIDLGP